MLPATRNSTIKAADVKETAFLKNRDLLKTERKRSLPVMQGDIPCVRQHRTKVKKISIQIFAICFYMLVTRKV